MSYHILFDVLDIEGKPTGKKLDIDTMHAGGHWHATVHVWIYDEHKHVLLKRRAADLSVMPGRWDISLEGHVASGEAPEAAAVRLLEEDLNVIIPTDYLTQVAAQSVELGNPLYAGEHREVVYTYVLFLPHETPFQVSADTLERLHWSGVSELLSAATDTAGETYVPHREGGYWREAAVWVQHAKIPKPKTFQRLPGRRHLGRIKYRVKNLLAATSVE